MSEKNNTDNKESFIGNLLVKIFHIVTLGIFRKK